MGLQGFDLYGSMLSFMDHLRIGLVPDVAVFLDGTNESEGFSQAVENPDAEYRQRYRQYNGFRDLVLNASLKHRLRNKVNTLFKAGGSTNGPGPIDRKTYLRLVADHATAYAMTARTLRKICHAYDIQPLFFLQPVVWDVWQDVDDPHYVYLKALYGEITRNCGEFVRDISGDSLIEPEMFYDWAHVNVAGNRHLAACLIANGDFDAA